MSKTISWDAPAARPRPSPSAPRAHRVRRATLATVAAGAIGGAIGAGHALASVATAILVVVASIAIVAAAELRSAARATIVVAIALFAPWLAVRSSPWLLVPDLIAASALVCVGLSVRNGGSRLDSAHGYRSRAAELLHGAAIAPQRALLGITAIDGQGRRQAMRGAIGPSALGLAIAAVVAIVLASGDAVFASYLELGDVVSSAVGRFVVAAVVMAVVVAASGAAAGAVARPAFPARRHGSATQLWIVMAPMVAVYVVFVVVQASALVLGAEYVHARTGLTFAEYARSGFFQLVAVGVLTFLAVTACRPVLRSAPPSSRRTLILVATVAVACTLVMVVAAVVKLELYADAFGLTMLRLYTSVFAVWLGLALVIAWWSLFRRRGEWVVPVVALTALCGVFAMNVVNPPRLVAEHNLATTIDSEHFDIDYLLGLGDAAVPAIVARADDLEPDAAAAVRAELCHDRRHVRALAWNHDRSAADAALADWC